jgi:glycerophosphoryl diester phosphodiesterase
VQIPAHPLVLGHRGAPREVPENTLRAFRLALEQGADGVELDVQPAADGVPVVIHDPSLDRTTDRTGSLAELGWDEIAGARAGGEPVPRLEEAVAWAADAGAWLNVEVKSPGAEAAAVRAVRAAGLMERTFFSSFLPGVVAALLAEGPDVTGLLLTERWDEEVMAGVRELGVAGVCLHHPLATGPALAWLRERGLHAVVWTVDDPARMRELFAEGVLAVISNLPAVAVAAREGSRAHAP